MKTHIALPLAITCFLTACAGTLQIASISEAFKKYETDDFKGALEEIARAESAKEMSAEQKAGIAYLKARSYAGLGQTDRAQALLVYIQEQHPRSQYAYLARREVERAQ